MESRDVVRDLCLVDELRNVRMLLREGFGALQEISVVREDYHLPQQLLASGVERLLKCHIAAVERERTGSYPSAEAFRRMGHSSVELRDRVVRDYFGGSSSFVSADRDFVASDAVLSRCLAILSLFGKFGRYYNLDVVGGEDAGSRDPTKEWQDLERDIEDPTQYAHDSERLDRDYYPSVARVIVGRLERLARAIVMQSTLGGHPASVGVLRRSMTVLSDFLHLNDCDFGRQDYRRSVAVMQAGKDHWDRLSLQDVESSLWPSEVLTRATFPGDWPFRFDEVAMELRDRLFAVVSIGGYAFALNGPARSRYGYPFPDEAGVAIPGQSVGAFIDRACALDGGRA